MISPRAPAGAGAKSRRATGRRARSFAPQPPFTCAAAPLRRPQVFWRWLNRVIPATWILYGLAGSQLAGKTAHPAVFAGGETTVSDLMSRVFGIERRLVPWTLVIMVAHILFVRVTSILALRYLNFLRR